MPAVRSRCDHLFRKSRDQRGFQKIYSREMVGNFASMKSGKVALSMEKFRTVGRPLVRDDGHGKVTGAAQYTADVPRIDALWGKFLHSPLAHARIVNIDASRAKRV